MTSSAIGQFVIGVSPIGTQPTFNVNQTVISQYANSPILMRILQDRAESLSMTALIDSFFDVMFNVDTAQDAGLDIWGRIVGVSRVIALPTDLDFGFEEAGATSAVGFGMGEFYSGGSLTTNYSLSNDAFRLLIMAKALSNISDCSIPSINQILLSLFPGRGNIYVQDGLDMTLTYVVTFETTDFEKAIIQGSGILPTPTGVFANYSFA